MPSVLGPQIKSMGRLFILVFRSSPKLRLEIHWIQRSVRKVHNQNCKKWSPHTMLLALLSGADLNENSKV